MGGIWSQPSVGDMIEEDMVWYKFATLLRDKYGEEEETGVSMAAAYYAMADKEFIMRHETCKDKIPYDLINNINERNKRGTYNRLEISELKRVYQVKTINKMFMDQHDRVWVPLAHNNFCYHLSVMEN